MRVRIGSSSNDKGGTLHKIKRIVQHKKFSPITIDFDFSLLKLADKIEFSDTTQPIALPGVRDRVRDNTTCLVTGWGDTQSPDESWDELRGAEVPIVNQQKCSEAYSSFNDITPRMLCAGFDKGGKDACQGDSGIFSYIGYTNLVMYNFK